MSGVSQASGTTLVSSLEKGGYMQKPKSIYPYSSALELKGQDPWLSAFSLVTTGLGHKRTWSVWPAIDSFLLSSTHCWVLHLKNKQRWRWSNWMSSFHLSLNPHTLCISIFCLYLCLWPLTPTNSPWSREVKWKLLSHVQLFATPWTMQSIAGILQYSPGQNTGVENWSSLLHGIF